MSLFFLKWMRKQSNSLAKGEIYGADWRRGERAEIVNPGMGL